MRIARLGLTIGRAAVVPVLVAALLGFPDGPTLAQTTPDAVLQSTYQQAEEAFREQRLDDAATGYRKLAALSPDTAEVHAKLGLIHYLQGRFHDAVPSLRRALDLKPSLPNVDALLAISLAGIGEHGEAVPGLEKGFADPANEQLRRLIGLELQRSLVALGRQERAATIVAQLERLYPDDPEVLYHTGRFHADMATAAMQHLLAVAPASVWGHQASGDALESLGNHELAIVEYRKALAKRPDLPGVHYSIARAIQSSEGAAGTEDDAMNAYRQELRIDSTHALAAYELGEILRKRSELGQARGFFQQAVTNRPDFALGRVGLGRVLRELDEPEQAKAHLEAAVRISPENEIARYQLALAYRALGDLASAEREMQAFQRIQRNEP